MVAPPSEAHCAIDGLGGERGDGEWEGDREAGGARPALWSVLLVYLARVPSVIFILDLYSNFEK